MLARWVPRVLATYALAAILAAQGLRSSDAYLLHGMLTNAYDVVKQHYYDPTYRGLDWDARYRTYDDKVKSATSVNAGMAEVARFLAELNDSPTYSQPPPPSVDIAYGYQLRLVGGGTIVTHVQPGTVAA